MDLSDQKANIKEYAILINSSLEDNEDLLDYVIDSVVDRALIYMNRLQLQAEADSGWYTDEEDIPPILPVELERVLAETVTGAYRTIEASPTADKDISSISDNGQSISYSERMASFLSGSDNEIFSSTLSLLSKYRLPTILEPTY